MITITKKEKKVLDAVGKYADDYEGGIPQEVLRNKLDIHEYQLYEILNSLNKKNIIKQDENRVNLLETDQEINTVDSKQDVIDAELDKIEQDSLDLIKTIVKDGVVPKY